MSEAQHPHYPNAVYHQHFGGPQPQDDTAVILPEYRGPALPVGQRISCAPAARLDWSHDGCDDDVVGYWLLPAKPYPA